MLASPAGPLRASATLRAIETTAATRTDPVSPGQRRGPSSLETAAEHGWMLVPGLLVVYLGFDAGGYFAGTTGLAAAIVSVLLAVRLLTAPPLRGLSGPGIAALIGAGALAALSLASQIWSHTPARALLAFDLCVLYLLVTALHSAAVTTAARLRTLILGLLGGLAIVCGAALLTRTLPHVFPLGPAFSATRLSYPVTYWNALGMLAALGIALGAHVASDRAAPAPLRMIGAGLVPAFGATLLLTFSRGAIGSLAVLLVLYIVLAPRLSVLLTALAVGPPAALALRTVYDAGALGSNTPTSPLAVSQGHHVVLVLALCMLATVVLRGLLILAERRVPSRRLPPRARTPLLVAAAVVVLVVAIAGSGTISHQYDSFVNGTVSSTGPARDRLLSVSNDGRLDLWRVAVRGFDRQPLHGQGAGTYADQWTQYRHSFQSVQNAHNLYLETLDELGVAGAVALALFLLGLLVAAARRLRPVTTRPVAALAVAALLSWALHSAVDWDWQMPAVMVGVLALAAAAGTADPDEGAPWPRGTARWPARVLAALGSLALGVAPGLVAVSQSDLDAAVRAFAAHDCVTAATRARAAHNVLSVRPEPLEILGYCQARTGHGHAAVSSLKAAVKDDPSDWEFRYALGLVSAEAGENPLPALRAAHRLDPLESSITNAYRALQGHRRRWRRIALAQPLDLP